MSRKATMRCPQCGHDNRPDATFCGECGTRFVAGVACERCGRANPAGQRFCDGCGATLTHEFRLPVRVSSVRDSFVDGRYLVERFLGAGAHKSVYLAHDTMLDREV